MTQGTEVLTACLQEAITLGEAAEVQPGEIYGRSFVDKLTHRIGQIIVGNFETEGKKTAQIKVNFMHGQNNEAAFIMNSWEAGKLTIDNDSSAGQLITTAQSDSVKRLAARRGELSGLLGDR